MVGVPDPDRPEERHFLSTDDADYTDFKSILKTF
jgi:hypothetical protein